METQFDRIMFYAVLFCWIVILVASVFLFFKKEKALGGLFIMLMIIAGLPLLLDGPPTIEGDNSIVGGFCMLFFSVLLARYWIKNTNQKIGIALSVIIVCSFVFMMDFMSAFLLLLRENNQDSPVAKIVAIVVAAGMTGTLMIVRMPRRLGKRPDERPDI